MDKWTRRARLERRLALVFLCLVVATIVVRVVADLRATSRPASPAAPVHTSRAR